MQDSIIKSILKINPNAQVSVSANDVKQIDWHDGTKPIAEKDILAKDFLNAWRQLESLRHRFREFTLPFDAILLPTTPLVPPITEKLLNDDSYFNENNLKALRNTRIANLFNQCALTIPTSTDFCGLSIMKPENSEQQLISLGIELERLF